MQQLTVNQIRSKFLDFFAAKEHFLLPSYPLVPQGDKSLLLINSGMAPMKAFFTGIQTPPSKRVATCQKCIRTVDIDDVGKDARHGSFFEMLGNFSFGDYFKKEVIPWAWEFLTVEMGIPADRLLISVYEEDPEAYDIWLNTIKVPAERIFKLDKNENFWEHGVGPCGPCSEIHYDRGEQYSCGSPNCTVGCDCDRFMEVWNLVFTQFEKCEDGSYKPLANPNIDTGMGLERLAIVLQEAAGIFDIDNIKGICTKVADLAQLSSPTDAQRVSINIIADHVRSVAFMTSDGVLPSNEGRGYILRRLLRRAVRHGKGLGLGKFVTAIAQVAIDAYGDAYPNLQEKSTHILQVLQSEESRFLETLDTGMALLQKQMDGLKAQNKTTLDGAEAFKLYDTYGFPPDLTREILEDAGLNWDEAVFEAEMEAQKNRARAARGTSTYMGADATVYDTLPADLATEFVGYHTDSTASKILAIVADDKISDTAVAGQDIALVLDKTPFYATGGGQKGDAGILKNASATIEITECKTIAGNTIHLGKITSGAVKVGDPIDATIDTARRKLTAANHSATHLLQKALKEVLGDHIEQAGSEVTPDRLRFDFTHFSAMTGEEKDKVEDIVNARIWADVPVEVALTTPEDARAKGATALFGEKYSDTVRMVKIGDYSTELCGGTHVATTGKVGLFKLVSEAGIASGVRRIEAITGPVAIDFYKNAHKTLVESAEAIKAKPHELKDKIQALLTDNKNLKKDMAKAQSAGNDNSQQAEDLIKNAVTINGLSIITAKIENCDVEALRNLSDKIKDKTDCLLLCGINNNVAQFLASASEAGVKKGIHAGNIVKAAASLCGGGGGGRPNHAQAGGKDITKVDEALAQALVSIKSIKSIIE